MKTKVFILAAMMVLVAACNKDTPTQPALETQKSNVVSQEMLLGTWSEPFHVSSVVRSLNFKEDGTLIYGEQPDTTFNIVFLWAPTSTVMQYEIKDNKLYVSGECTRYPLDAPSYTEHFTIVCGCNVYDNKLSVDSFSCDGERFIKPLVLYKQ